MFSNRADKPYNASMFLHKLLQSKLIHKLYTDNPFLFAAPLCACFILSFVHFLPVRFEENDDVMMMLISSGVMSGSPDEHLVFINVLLGQFFKLAYTYLPDYEHYTNIFIALHILSSGIIVAFIHKRLAHSIYKLLLILLFLSFEAALLVLLQFTTTSALVATAAIICLLDNKAKVKWCGAALFLIAFALRYHAAFLVLITCIPLFLSRSYFQLKNLPVYVAIVCALSAAYMYDLLHYNKSPEWKYYKSYNALRGQINDNLNFSPERMDFYTKSSKNDYLLLYYFFPDPSVITLDEVIAIHSKLQKFPIQDKLKNIPTQFGDYFIFLGLVYLLIILSFIYASDSNKQLIASILAIHLMILAMVALNGLLKRRVLFTALLPVLFIAVPLVTHKLNWLKHLILGIFTIYVVKMNKIIINSATTTGMIFTEQQEMMAKHQSISNKALLAYGDDYKWEYANPFKITHTYKNNMVGAAGWLTAMPFDQQLKSFRELLDTKALFITRKNFDRIVPLIVQSLEENHKLDVCYNISLQSENYVVVSFFNKKDTNICAD